MMNCVNILFAAANSGLFTAAFGSDAIVTQQHNYDDEEAHLHIDRIRDPSNRNEIFPVDPFLVSSVENGRIALEEFNMEKGQETPCWRDLTRLFAKESCKRMNFGKKMRLAVA